MDRRRAAFLLALSAAAGTALLVTESNPVLEGLVVLLGAGVASTVLTGYGGQYIFLCLGEAFAVGLGTTSPVLGVLFQPAIAGMLSDDNRTSLIVGGATTIMAAAGVLVFRQPLFLLLGVLVASICLASGLVVYETWLCRRLASGDVA